MYNQLSVEKAMAKRATAMMADIVASDNVTAEQGILSVFDLSLCFFFKTSQTTVNNDKNQVLDSRHYTNLPLKKKILDRDTNNLSGIN